MSVKIFRCSDIGENSLGILEMQIMQWEEAENRKRTMKNHITITCAAQSHPTPEETILTIFYE